MRTVELITKKRDGGELSRAEIEFFVNGLTSGEIPDYQAAALAMAIYFQGMSQRETADLTLAMAHSGEVLDLSDVVDGIVVDKHSTGGVGDKTTLVVEPMVAACGVRVGKMSGRGLGFSGGTLDKMESFPGYRIELTTQEFRRQLAEVGLVLAGPSADLAPADGKLYALRDVTGTVPSIPLIASSVMCKKIAGGAQAIVLDVKVGSGAFVPDVESGRRLAQAMVDIGRDAGRRVVALLSDMNQPLGCAVGNALEVMEAIETLQGGGPPDLREHALTVAGHLLVLAGRAESLEAARELSTKAIADGSALGKFRQLVAAQGGDASFVDDTSRFPAPALSCQICGAEAGYVGRVDARHIAEAAVTLGASRARKGDALDLAVGLVVHRKVGDRVEPGEPLVTVYANDQARLLPAARHVEAGLETSPEFVEPLPLFYGLIRSDEPG